MIITRRSLIADHTPSAEAWAEARRMARRNLEEMTPEENAAITADAMSDPDSGWLSEEEMEKAQWMTFAEAHGRERDVLALDSDVSARLREGGEDWQVRANAILRKALETA